MTDLFDLLESKVDEETKRTGAMIALRPRQDHIDRLAVEGGEPPEELHTTILFMGKAADYSYDTRARIIQAMREIAVARRFVTGNGFAVNVFNPNGEDPCIVLGVGGKELVEIRDAIVKSLMGFDLMMVPEQHEPWVPHITLKYTDDHKEATNYIDLTGEVVYDAIRVVFGGIVDDIPLQPAVSGEDGYAGPNSNRYANVPTGLKTAELGKCLYCKAKATKKIGIDGGAYLTTCEGHETRGRREADGEGMKTERIPVMSGVVLDEKTIRRVRTAAGVRRFGQPIGTVIVADGTLKNLKTVESDYEGYEKYTRKGKPVYTRKEGNKYVAYDENDAVLASYSSEEGLLRVLDRDGGDEGSPAERDDGPGNRSPRKKQRAERYPNVKKNKSEYEGYDHYTASDGDYWVDQETNEVYDADDEVVYWGTRDEVMSWLNGDPEDGPSKERKPSDIEDEEPEPSGPGGAKPPSRISKAPAKKPRSTNGNGGAPTPTRGDHPSNVRELLAGLIKPDNLADLNATLDKVKGKTATAKLIEEIRDHANRQRDVRNKRKLNMFANELAESKVFDALVDMDPQLKGIVLSTKLITPGGRVGTDRRLGSRSNGENWVERTAGELPKYIRIVRNGLMKAGHGESRATAMAVAAMKRWARGANNVRPAVQAAAAKALAQWEAMKAAA